MPPKNQRLVAGLVQLTFLAVIVGMVALVYFKTRGKSGGISSKHSEADLPALLAAPPGQQRNEGIAVAVLIDTSGSMEGAVPDKSGRNRPKIEIARAAVANVVAQLQMVAKERPERPLRLGIYEFSGRSGDTVRQVIAFGEPSAPAAKEALDRLKTQGGTPIGDAMAQARRDLNQLALTKQHILVVTDGENTEGFDPAVVMNHLAKLPEDQRPGVYFVAFDVAASAFAKVKEAGALVLPAADEKELQATLDQVIAEKVLVE